MNKKDSRMIIQPGWKGCNTIKIASVIMLIFLGVGFVYSTLTAKAQEDPASFHRAKRSPILPESNTLDSDIKSLLMPKTEERSHLNREKFSVSEDGVVTSSDNGRILQRIADAAQSDDAHAATFTTEFSSNKNKHVDASFTESPAANSARFNPEARRTDDGIRIINTGNEQGFRPPNADFHRQNFPIQVTSENMKSASHVSTLPMGPPPQPPQPQISVGPAQSPIGPLCFYPAPCQQQTNQQSGGVVFPDTSQINGNSLEFSPRTNYGFRYGKIPSSPVYVVPSYGYPQVVPAAPFANNFVSAASYAPSNVQLLCQQVPSGDQGTFISTASGFDAYSGIPISNPYNDPYHNHVSVHYRNVEELANKKYGNSSNKSRAVESQCGEGSKFCQDDGSCYEESRWCDKIVDCEDGSDESQCPCISRIDKLRICDNFYDCPLGEDELGCMNCGPMEFSCNEWSRNRRKSGCFTLEQKCDGIPHCANGMDENDCNLIHPEVNHHSAFEISHLRGFLHRNYQGKWYPVCGNPYKWANEACSMENENNDSPPFIQLLSMKSEYQGNFVEEYNENELRFKHGCFNHSAVFVTCSKLLCGVRNVDSNSIPKKAISDEDELYDRTKRHLDCDPVIHIYENDQKALFGYMNRQGPYEYNQYISNNEHIFQNENLQKVEHMNNEYMQYRIENSMHNENYKAEQNPFDQYNAQNYVLNNYNNINYANNPPNVENHVNYLQSFNNYENTHEYQSPENMPNMEYVPHNINAPIEQKTNFQNPERNYERSENYNVFPEYLPMDMPQADNIHYDYQNHFQPNFPIRNNNHNEKRNSVKNNENINVYLSNGQEEHALVETLSQYRLRNNFENEHADIKELKNEAEFRNFKLRNSLHGEDEELFDPNRDQFLNQGVQAMPTTEDLRYEKQPTTRQNIEFTTEFFKNETSNNKLDEDKNANENEENEKVRIVGGKQSSPAAWPWVVTVYRNGNFHCGGVIIDEQWIMSAAHCVTKYWKYFFEIRAGILRRFSHSPHEQLRTVTHVVAHELYDKSVMSNDISLLKLDRPLLINKWVRPVCLPSESSAGQNWLWGPSPGTICTAVGWGATKESGADPDHLREVEVPILINCKHREDETGEEICAGLSKGGRDACQGDSGGPFLCKNPKNQNQWYLAGIVSHGEGCARANEPGVYTRVSIFRDWIRESLADDYQQGRKPKQECPGFSCIWGSARCIPKKRRCDKIVDCLGGEDEMNCAGVVASSFDDDLIMDDEDEFDLFRTFSSHKKIETVSGRSSNEEKEIRLLGYLNPQFYDLHSFIHHNVKDRNISSNVPNNVFEKNTTTLVNEITEKLSKEQKKEKSARNSNENSDLITKFYDLDLFWNSPKQNHQQNARSSAADSSNINTSSNDSDGFDEDTVSLTPQPEIYFNNKNEIDNLTNTNSGEEINESTTMKWEMMNNNNKNFTFDDYLDSSNLAQARSVYYHGDDEIGLSGIEGVIDDIVGIDLTTEENPASITKMEPLSQNNFETTPSIVSDNINAQTTAGQLSNMKNEANIDQQGVNENSPAMITENVDDNSKSLVTDKIPTVQNDPITPITFTENIAVENMNDNSMSLVTEKMPSVEHDPNINEQNADEKKNTPMMFTENIEVEKINDNTKSLVTEKMPTVEHDPNINEQGADEKNITPMMFTENIEVENINGNSKSLVTEKMPTVEHDTNINEQGANENKITPMMVEENINGNSKPPVTETIPMIVEPSPITEGGNMPTMFTENMDALIMSSTTEKMPSVENLVNINNHPVTNTNLENSDSTKEPFKNGIGDVPPNNNNNSNIHNLPLTTIIPNMLMEKFGTEQASEKISTTMSSLDTLPLNIEEQDIDVISNDNNESISHVSKKELLANESNIANNIIEHNNFYSIKKYEGPSRHDSYYGCKIIKQLIPISKRCDRYTDCEDNSDESGCSCADYIKFTHPFIICDGHIDCADKSDEENCSSCPPRYFRCLISEICIPNERVCDQRKDCEFGEDEIDCFGLIKSTDLSENENFQPNLNREGFLSLKKDGMWKFVCDEAFNFRNEIEPVANQLCNYLGFGAPNTVRPNTINISHPTRANQCTALHIQCSISQINILPTLSPNAILNYNLNDYINANRDRDIFNLPWMGKVYADAEYKCSGVLIHHYWLLIEKACRHSLYLEYQYVSVVLGSRRNIISLNGANEQILRVDGDNYISFSSLCLLHLEKPAIFNKYVKSVFIPEMNFKNRGDEVCIATAMNSYGDPINVHFRQANVQCGMNNICFQRVNSTEICEPSTSIPVSSWSGIIVCNGEKGWYAAASYNMTNGACGLGNMFSFPNIATRINDISVAIASNYYKRIAEISCMGVRCPLGQCILPREICDGVYNCRDGFDESYDTCHYKNAYCQKNPYTLECLPRDAIQCRNGRWVAKTDFANGVNDCGDNSDEPSPLTCAAYLQLTAPDLLCDGYRHCQDKTDENPNYCKCSSVLTYHCPNCDQCIPQDYLCDGTIDCPGGEDEFHCIGLGRFNDHGIGGELMIQNYGIWYPRCYDHTSFTKNELEMICLEAGYTSGHADLIKVSQSNQPAVRVVTEEFQNVYFRNGNISFRSGKYPYAYKQFIKNSTCNTLYIQCL